MYAPRRKNMYPPQEEHVPKTKFLMKIRPNVSISGPNPICGIITCNNRPKSIFCICQRSTNRILDFGIWVDLGTCSSYYARFLTILAALPCSVVLVRIRRSRMVTWVGMMTLWDNELIMCALRQERGFAEDRGVAGDTKKKVTPQSQDFRLRNAPR